MTNLIDAGGLDPDTAVSLFESWLLRLSEDALGVTAYSSGGTSLPHRYTIGEITGPHFAVDIGDDLTVALADCVDVDTSEASALVNAALGRTAARDLGDVIVYGTEMEIQTLNFAEMSVLHFMRVLGDQVHIEGPRRLSDVAILDFQEGLLDSAPEQGLLLAPASIVKLKMFVRGPTSSAFTNQAANNLTEVIAAICAFAAGRPVKFTPPMFPLEGEAAQEALVRQRDPSILGLARNGVSLDIFGELAALGDADAVFRALQL